jgi:FPC/CPF motif-containing protein YcgG
MKYAFEMGSGALIYIPSFMMTGSAILKLIRLDTHTYIETQRQQGDFISLVLFFKNKESRLTTQRYTVSQIPLMLHQQIVAYLATLSLQVD